MKKGIQFDIPLPCGTLVSFSGETFYHSGFWSAEIDGVALALGWQPVVDGMILTVAKVQYRYDAATGELIPVAKKMTDVEKINAVAQAAEGHLLEQLEMDVYLLTPDKRVRLGCTDVIDMVRRGGGDLELEFEQNGTSPAHSTRRLWTIVKAPVFTSVSPTHVSFIDNAYKEVCNG